MSSSNQPSSASASSRWGAFASLALLAAAGVLALSSAAPQVVTVAHAQAGPSTIVPVPTGATFTTQWSQANDLSTGLAFAFSFLFGTQMILLGGTKEVKILPDGNVSFVASDMAYAGTSSQLWRPYAPARLPIPMWGYFAQLNGQEDLFVTAMSTSQRFSSEPLGLVYSADTDDPGTTSLEWVTSAPLSQSGINSPVRRRSGFFAVDDVVTFIGGVDINQTFIPDIISYNRSSREWLFDTTIPPAKQIQSICDCQVQVLGSCTVAAICNECETQRGKGGRRYKAIQVVYNPCTKGIQTPVALPFTDPIISFDTTRVGHFLVSMVGLVVLPPRPDPNNTIPDGPTPPSDESAAGAPWYAGDNETTTTTDANMSSSSTVAPTTTDVPATNATTTRAPRPPQPTPGDDDFKVLLYMTDLFNLEVFESDNLNLRRRFGGTLYSEGANIFYAGGFTDMSKTSFSTAVDTAKIVPPVFVALERASRVYHVGDEIAFTTENYHAGMMVRLALSPLCTFAVPGTVDAVVYQGNPGNGKGTLGNVSYAADNVYLCISNGVCNQKPDEHSVRCRGGNSQANFETCTMNRCCWVNNSCWEFEDGKGKYFMLASPMIPLSIVAPSNVEPAPFYRTTGGIILITFGSGVIVVVSLIIALLIINRRSKSKLSKYAEEDEAHALEPSGKYKVVRKLGQGGFGSVFLVQRRSDGKELALKHMSCPNAEERDYAIKEFQLLHNAQGHENMIHLEEMLISWGGVENINSLNDDNAAVVQVEGEKGAKKAAAGSAPKDKKTSEEDDRNPLLPLLRASSRYVCIVMEYCAEGDLARMMLNTPKYRKGLPETMIIGYAKQICSLLMHLHSLDPPIVHRDLKPENVLLKNNRTQAVLTDFGLAQQLEKSYMTTRAGTLHFIAPECWKKHYTATVDMWSLGCILWACCTGRVTNSTARVMFKDARSPTFEVEINHEMRNYSKLLRRVVLGLLRIKIDHRLTAQQALDLLAQWKESDALVPSKEWDDDN